MKQRREQGRGARSARRLGRLAAGAVVIAFAAACTGGGRSEYAQDGDTGAASPGTSPDSSTARMIGPDSTLGKGGRTGEPGVAGDTTASRGMPAGSTDSATRARLDSTARRPAPPSP